MENKQADIQQIQKYLNGELDARAMHKLERRAQDDPFLMDALEGYGAVKTDQQSNLAALQQQLEARTATKVRRMAPWAATAIAASVIGFAVVLGLLYKNSGNDKQLPQVAMIQLVKIAPADITPVVIGKQAEQVITTPQKQTIVFKRKALAKPFAPINIDTKANTAVQQKEIATASLAAAKNEPAISVLEEMVASDMIANKKQDTVLDGEFIAINKNASQLTVIKSKAAGAGITTRPGKATDNNPTALANAGLPPNLMAGAIIDRKDAQPLPDASGRVNAKKVTTAQANAYGYTRPDIKKDDGNAEVSSFGTKSSKNNDSAAAQVKTSPILRQVAIADKNIAKTANARPLVGWDDYRKYLLQNAVSPDGKAGTVELKVTINPNGSIAEVAITKGLSIAADVKAISIIQNGPAWVGNSSGKAEDVKVKVEFHK